MDPDRVDAEPFAVDLYWIPLGAGGWFVRLNGRVFEALSAFVEGRPPLALYHSAVIVTAAGCPCVIEMTPALPAAHGDDRGVVAHGPVGAGWAGALAAFRYEIRCWPGGAIPDVVEAVDSPVRVSTRPDVARRILALAPAVPTLVWGRDQLHVGDMWNSNSVVSWLLETAGVDASAITPPPGGRAPGWRAGLVAARRPRCSPAPPALARESAD